MSEADIISQPAHNLAAHITAHVVNLIQLDRAGMCDLRGENVRSLTTMLAGQIECLLLDARIQGMKREIAERGSIDEFEVTK